MGTTDRDGGAADVVDCCVLTRDADFRTFGLSDFRTFGLSDFRTFGLSEFRSFGVSDMPSKVA